MTDSIYWIPDYEPFMLSPEGFETILSRTLLSMTSIQNEQSNQDFLNRVHDIISSSTVPPINRFYALYLLLKTLEKSNKLLDSQLAAHNDVISFIKATAQFQFYSKTTNNKRGCIFFQQAFSQDEMTIGINFVRLSVEILIFLQSKYESRAGSEPWRSFFVQNQSFQNHLKRYSSFNFLNKQYDLSQNLATWDFMVALPTQQKLEVIKLPIESESSKYKEAKSVVQDQEPIKLALDPETTKASFNDKSTQLHISLEDGAHFSENFRKNSEDNVVSPDVPSKKPLLNFLPRPRHSVELESFSWKNTLEKNSGSTTTSSSSSQKGIVNFSNLACTPQAKNNDKVMGELSEISKSIERSKNKLSRFGSVKFNKKEALNDTPQKEVNRRSSFSILFSEKDEKSPHNSLMPQKIIDLNSSQVANKYDTKEKSPKVIIWNQENNRTSETLQTKNFSNFYWDYNLTPKKGLDPFSKNQ